MLRDHLSQGAFGEERKTAECQIETELEVLRVFIRPLTAVPSFRGQCKAVILIMNLGYEPQHVFAEGVGKVLFGFHQPMEGEAEQHSAGRDYCRGDRCSGTPLCRDAHRTSILSSCQTHLESYRSSLTAGTLSRG